MSDCLFNRVLIKPFRHYSENSITHQDLSLSLSLSFPQRQFPIHKHDFLEWGSYKSCMLTLNVQLVHKHTHKHEHEHARTAIEKTSECPFNLKPCADSAEIQLVECVVCPPEIVPSEKRTQNLDKTTKRCGTLVAVDPKWPNASIYHSDRRHFLSAAADSDGTGSRRSGKRRRSPAGSGGWTPVVSLSGPLRASWPLARQLHANPSLTLVKHLALRRGWVRVLK